MDPVTIGIIGVAALIVIFLLGVPVGFTMALVGVVGFMATKGADAGLSLLARDFWDTWSNYNLTIIPMFVFMGSIAFYAGMSGRLYDAAYIIFGRWRGGLAMATVVATAAFSAICGSTSATAAAMGKVAIPEMRRHGYDPGLASGCMAAAGSLGIMIPPSTIFIVYGLLTGESIGRLFVAGVIPGLLISAVFIFVVYVICSMHPEYGPAGPYFPLKEKLLAAGGFLDAVILFTLLIGGLLAGLFGPNAAGGIGAAGIICIGLVRGQLSWAGLKRGLREGLSASAMVLCIVAGATVFGKFITLTTLPQQLVTELSGTNISPMITMILILVGYFIGGCFMDSLPLVVLTVPMIFPVIRALGFNPIWFGVMIVLLVEIGVITPPVGVNVYVIKGISSEVPMSDIFKGIMPFLAGLIVVCVILLIFPQIATWLPSYITY